MPAGGWLNFTLRAGSRTVSKKSTPQTAPGLAPVLCNLCELFGGLLRERRSRYSRSSLAAFQPLRIAAASASSPAPRSSTR